MNYAPTWDLEKREITLSHTATKEIIKGSAIAPDIALANFRSVHQDEGFEFLIDINKVSGKKQPPAQWNWYNQRDFSYCSGWVFQGADPLNNGEPMDWGKYRT